MPVVPLYLSGLRALRPKGSRHIEPGPVGLHIQRAHKFAKGTDVVSVTKALQTVMNEAHQVHGPVQPQDRPDPGTRAA